MSPTIDQMRQQMKEKIESMRRATEGDIADDNARAAVAALSIAETWYAAAHNKKRWMQIHSCRSQFETAEKNFWKVVKGGAE